MSSDPLGTVGTARIQLLRNGLRLMALRALQDEDLAEDVVQEVMLRALNAVTVEIAETDERLGAFVGGIARHVIADTHRAARKARLLEPTIHALPIDDDALNVLVAREEAERLEKVIRKLSSPDQIIIRASFYEGLTPAEIAERVAEPAERVRKRKSRALARLRAALQRAPRHDPASFPSIKENNVAAQGGG